jgi:hypothetical protein
MATTAATTNYSTLCDACRADGAVSVARTEAPRLGCCALCGDEIPALVAALLKAPGARPCRDCRGVCLPEEPCACCRELAAMQDELAWEA